MAHMAGCRPTASTAWSIQCDPPAAFYKLPGDPNEQPVQANLLLNALTESTHPETETLSNGRQWYTSSPVSVVVVSVGDWWWMERIWWLAVPDGDGI
jgi:hypothetical protein